MESNPTCRLSDFIQVTCESEPIERNGSVDFGARRREESKSSPHAKAKRADFAITVRRATQPVRCDLQMCACAIKIERMEARPGGRAFGPFIGERLVRLAAPEHIGDENAIAASRIRLRDLAHRAVETKHLRQDQKAGPRAVVEPRQISLELAAVCFVQNHLFLCDHLLDS